MRRGLFRRSSLVRMTPENRHRSRIRIESKTYLIAHTFLSAAPRRSAGRSYFMRPICQIFIYYNANTDKNQPFLHLPFTYWRSKRRLSEAFGQPPFFSWFQFPPSDPYPAYAAAPWPAMRPKTTKSATALPPRRFPPWTPPVTSPAAKRPGMTVPSVAMTCA